MCYKFQCEEFLMFPEILIYSYIYIHDILLFLFLKFNNQIYISKEILDICF